MGLNTIVIIPWVGCQKGCQNPLGCLWGGGLGIHTDWCIRELTAAWLNTVVNTVVVAM